MAAVSDIVVRPSAGVGQPPSVIPVDLVYYCVALERAQPGQIVTTTDVEGDVAQMHASAVAKGTLLDESSFGLTVSWSPHKLAHSVNPSDPGTWDSGANIIGVVYQVRMQGGATAFFSVSTS